MKIGDIVKIKGGNDDRYVIIGFNNRKGVELSKGFFTYKLKPLDYHEMDRVETLEDYKQDELELWHNFSWLLVSDDMKRIENEIRYLDDKAIRLSSKYEKLKKEQQNLFQVGAIYVRYDDLEHKHEHYLLVQVSYDDEDLETEAYSLISLESERFTRYFETPLSKHDIIEAMKDYNFKKTKNKIGQILQGDVD